MTQEPFGELLGRHLVREKRPLRILVLNTGGTITSVVDEKGHLTPANSEETLNKLIMEMLGFRDYVEAELLTLKINHLFAIDSSQMQNEHRKRIAQELRENYAEYDGAIVFHGTDTGDRTAKFLHLALPYYDPIALWQNQMKKILNFCKPVVIVSSQISLLNERGALRIDSDGMMNVAVAANLIAQNEVGEVGILANKEEVIRGTAATKGSETELPAYLLDKGIPPIGRYASDGIHYTPGAYLKKEPDSSKKPLSIEDVSPYENKVLVAFDTQHLDPLRAYFRAKDGNHNEVEEFLRENLPEVVIYVSKGAGNVDGKDYSVLERAARELGLSIFRVPIPGGRIPDRQIYAVPGHDLPAVNMQPTTAEYKAMMTLSLAGSLRIESGRRREFIRYMMTEKWSNEILPPRFTI